MSSAVKACCALCANCSQAEHWPAPVFKVPWVVREPSNQALKDSRFCKEVLSSEDKEKTATNLKLYSLFNEAFFPIYLPGRYHSMDCVALKNMTKVKGHYWTHASHFLLSNQLHGVIFWQLTAHHGSEPALAKELQSLPMVSRKKRSEMFKDGLELCQTSAEFLLDPWVLMQLPWSPVLLLQWTAGALTEFYSLRLELVELYRWHLPLMQSRITRKLFILLKDMSSYLFEALYHVQVHYCSTSKTYSYERASFFLNLLTHKLLPLLEFVISGMAQNIVRALKRLSFGNNFDRNSSSTMLAHYQIFEWENTYNCFLSNHFWRQGNSNEVLGIYLDGPQAEKMKKSGVVEQLHGSDEFVMKATPQWIAQMETKYGNSVKTDKIFSVLEDKFNKDIIAGVSKQDLLRGIDFHKSYFTHCYYRLMELKANIDGGLRDEDAGVIYDVVCMRTKFRIADVQCAMFAKLANFCHQRITPKVQLNELNAEGPKMSLSQISGVITETSDRIKKVGKISCWKNLKQRVPVSCRGKVNSYEECPNLAEEGALKVSEKFEDRIKRIMFNVFEDHESWSENQIKLHPDQKIVQYVLPCFVASLLEFADNNDVEQKDKENYVRIVHELIKGFEVDPYKVASMQGPFAGGYSPYMILYGHFLKDVLRWQSELLCRGLQIALGSSPKAINVAETLDTNFISVLLNLDSTHSVEHVEYRYQEYMWRIQVYGLFNRIMKAIETTVPGCLPNLSALEMTMIANICFVDHTGVDADPVVTTTITSAGQDPIFKQLCLVTKWKALRLLNVKTWTVDDEMRDAFQYMILIECQRLSLEQITSLIVYYSVQKLAGKGMDEIEGEIRVPMDRTEEVYIAYRTGDQVKLKLLLGKMFTRYGINFSEVSYDFAKQSAPFVYMSALTQVKNGRVQMMQPCELNLLPIKHCRWCGLVRNDALRLCEECKADRGFPYRTWFCSNECERLAMDKLHREEHVRHLLLSLGIEDVKERVELKPEAPSGAKKKKKKSKICTCKHAEADHDREPV